MSIGQIIREYREKMGFTQEELAEKIGKSRIMVYYYENDKKPVPKLVLAEIKNILKIPAFDFIDEAFFNNETTFKWYIDELEERGFRVLFDKDENVFLYKNGKEIFSSSKDTMMGLIDFELLDRCLQSLNTETFIEKDFINFLNKYNYKIEKKEDKFILKDIDGATVLPKDFLYKTLTVVLKVIKKEINEFKEANGINIFPF